MSFAKGAIVSSDCSLFLHKQLLDFEWEPLRRWLLWWWWWKADGKSLLYSTSWISQLVFAAWLLFNTNALMLCLKPKHGEWNSKDADNDDAPIYLYVHRIVSHWMNGCASAPPIPKHRWWLSAACDVTVDVTPHFQPYQYCYKSEKKTHRKSAPVLSTPFRTKVKYSIKVVITKDTYTFYNCISFSISLSWTRRDVHFMMQMIEFVKKQHVFSPINKRRNRYLQS